MAKTNKNSSSSLGGFAGGLIIGLLLGLALALGVALYISNVPIPFVDKLPQRTAEQDKAEAERNKTWDPNAPLTPNPQPLPASTTAAPAAVAGVASVSGATPGPSSNTTASNTTAPASAVVSSVRDPAAILADAAKPPTASTDAAAGAFTYLVQVGAFTRTQDAEAQRAALAMQGFTAKVQEREQAGRTVYRVRLGPFDTKAEADALLLKLQGVDIDGQLVRIQKP